MKIITFTRDEISWPLFYITLKIKRMHKRDENAHAVDLQWILEYLLRYGIACQKHEPERLQPASYHSCDAF